jgi:hypothetical protein
MKKIKLLFLLFGIGICRTPAPAQVTSGKIVYERKTNLYKKFSEEAWVQDYVKERDKIKVDVLELYFNDSQSVFRPQESELKENFSWMTEKNTVYQNFQERHTLYPEILWATRSPSRHPV